MVATTTFVDVLNLLVRIFPELVAQSLGGVPLIRFLKSWGYCLSRDLGPILWRQHAALR